MVKHGKIEHTPALMAGTMLVMLGCMIAVLIMEAR